VEYLKATQLFPRPYPRITSHVYNIYETIPPLDTTWYTIWAKVIVIVATYCRVVTAGVNDQQEQEPHGAGGRPQRERRGCGIAPVGRSHQGGGEGVVVDPTMISLVLRFQSPEV